MSKARARSKLRPWLLFASLAAIATVIYVWRGHVGCLAYPECNPLLSVAEMQDWKVPTNPHEKKMYDLAHSLVLPEGVAEPVPFDFKAARLKDLYGDRSVEQQYFEHLCATESRDYVFKRIPNVDGFQIMRPRPQTMDTPEDFDRYGVEEPVGFGWMGDEDQFDWEWDFVAEQYVQPLIGVYSFVEMIDSAQGGTIVRVERASNEDTLKKYPRGLDAQWRTPTSGVIRVPNLMSHRTVDHISARYGYIWRGLRRPRDREFGIGGGEFMVIDLVTNEVLGLRRSFNSTYMPRRPDLTKWSAARECVALEKSTPIVYLINAVLNVDVHVNDEFIPPYEQSEYHYFLKRRMGD